MSAENDAGSHLSARPVIYTFPLIDNAQWVVVDDKNPYVYDRADPVGHSQALGALVLNQTYRSVFARDGVYVFKRIAGPPSKGTRARAVRDAGRRHARRPRPRPARPWPR